MHGFTPLPSRQVLDWPTISGNQYQFDALFTTSEYTHAIECKRKKLTTNENLFYFNAKILDYVLATKVRQLQGIFLSTAPIERSAKVYALGYGLTAIDPQTPPLDYLMGRTASEGPLGKALALLKQKIDGTIFTFSLDGRTHPPTSLYSEYEFLLNRWRRENE